MKNHLVICFAALVTFASIDAAASTCNKPPVDKSLPNLQKTAALALEETVTECDLQNKYDSNQFPRFYLDLNKGLSQVKNQASILELAFDLAKDSVEKNNLEKSELIYQIILAHFPAESRAMSSYAAVYIIREEYSEALRLLTQATAISPQDPIILSNLYVLNVWLGKYEAASNLNKQLLKAEPEISQHVTRRALLDVLYSKKRNDDSWQRLLKIQTEKNKAYWEYFCGALAKADKTRNFAELIDMGNQWIDNGMSSEALLLFDHILTLENVPTAHFLKAKALEQGKHYKLAFQSAQNALQMATSIDGKNEELYGNILYETARLAYAANEYESSLALLNKYKNSGYSHPHLDYMFAVNLDASGKHSDAVPYLQKCVTQQLPDFMLNFCKKTLANHAIASKPETTPPDNKAIRISNKGDSPSSAMRLPWPSPTVGWLGEVIDADVTETNTTLHIRLTAQLLQPTTAVEIEDGKHYEIPIEPRNPAELFVVNLNFGSLTKDKVQGLKESITKEKYLIAQGRVTYFGMFKKQLAPGVLLERAIFTSKITPNELR